MDKKLSGGYNSGKARPVSSTRVRTSCERPGLMAYVTPISYLRAVQGAGFRLTAVMKSVISPEVGPVPTKDKT